MYFDSFAIEPPSEIKKFMERVQRETKLFYSKPCSLHVNTMRHQFRNSECGVYSIHFIVSMLDGLSFPAFVKNVITDAQMNQYRKLYFSVNPQYDRFTTASHNGEQSALSFSSNQQRNDATDTQLVMSGGNAFHSHIHPNKTNRHLNHKSSRQQSTKQRQQRQQRQQHKNKNKSVHVHVHVRKKTTRRRKTERGGAKVRLQKHTPRRNKNPHTKTHRQTPK